MNMENKEIKLKPFEKICLQDIRSLLRVKYIVRNKDNKLFVFKNQPRKDNKRGKWIVDNNRDYYNSIPDRFLLFINWEDKKPYKIVDLLKEEK